MPSLGLSAFHILLRPSVRFVSFPSSVSCYGGKEITFFLVAYVCLSILGFPVLGTTIAVDEEIAVLIVFIMVAARGLLVMWALGVASIIMRGKVGGGELLATVFTVVQGQRMATQVKREENLAASWMVC